jgi:hypothetical protein
VRRSDVIHAKTAAGYDLPVIDVTHPAFALPESPQALEALRTQFRATEDRQYWLSRPLMRLLMTLAARRSLMLRAMLRSDTPYLSGLSTYVMKLGVDNLVPPFDGPVDRKIAASAAVTSIRLRLQQTARLLAEGLAPELRAQPRTPLHLLNIGGGPAIDSLNALILLRRMDPGLLQRPVTVRVLDLDAEGPAFGQNALAALQADGAPLAGLDIAFRHEPYDWNDTAILKRRMKTVTAHAAIIAASSEGALFDYADDAAIVANLAALNAGGRGVRAVAGSLTRADETTHRMLANSPFKLVPRSVETFGRLAARAEFAVAQVAPALLGDQVLLVPDRS